MTRPLSLDLRERVVASVLAGESCRSVAERFGVAVSSVVKWSQRQRAIRCRSVPSALTTETSLDLGPVGTTRASRLPSGDHS